MKKPLIFLLTLISGLTFASSPDFSYELIKTKETPGFFMVKIFASPQAKAIRKREVYVKNYHPEEEKIYRELFPFLQQQRHARIVKTDEFRPEKVNPQKNVVIALGEPLRDYLNFRYQPGEDIFEQFQNFAEKNLSPVLLKNIKIDFGGNIFAVQTKQAEVRANSPAIFVGKFRENLKTKINIQGETADGKLELNTFLDLDNPQYSEDRTAEYLPELWNELAHPSVKNPAKKSTTGINWFKVLRYFLTFLAILFVIAIIRYFTRSKEETDEFQYEEEVPIFHSQIPEEEYRRYEAELDNQQQNIDDLPFEVVWKQTIE